MYVYTNSTVLKNLPMKIEYGLRAPKTTPIYETLAPLRVFICP